MFAIQTESKLRPPKLHRKAYATEREAYEEAVRMCRREERDIFSSYDIVNGIHNRNLDTMRVMWDFSPTRIRVSGTQANGLDNYFLAVILELNHERSN